MVFLVGPRETGGGGERAEKECVERFQRWATMAEAAEELAAEVLECARYGEDDDLVVCGATALEPCCALTARLPNTRAHTTDNSHSLVIKVRVVRMCPH